MRVCNSRSIPIVNAVVDSMGGIAEDGDDGLTEPSLLCKSIQKAQTELRQEYDVREESRRELEFLEKGGDPLDFKLNFDAPVSVQSTSLTDQLPEHFVTRSSPPSFVKSKRNASLLEISTAQIRTDAHIHRFIHRLINKMTSSDANIADNLMLFESKVQLHKNGIQNVKKSGNTADFGITRQAYTRRNRSRPNRDVARSISTVDLISSHKRFLKDSEKQKDCKVSSKLNKNVPEAPIDIASVELDCAGEKEQVHNRVISGKNNGFRSTKRDKRNTSTGFDSDSSCTQIGVSLDEKAGSGICTTSKNINDDATTEGDKSDKENNQSKVVRNFGVNKYNCGNSLKSHEKDSCVVKLNELEESEPDIKNEVDDPNYIGGMDQETERTESNLLTTNTGGNVCSTEEFFESKVSIKVSTVDSVQQNCSGNKLDDRAHQDSIIEEARVIEGKHKRIAELSVGILWRENCPKSHWDFVLEEVVWLANDFAQERIWKITAAAQICHQVSFSSRVRIQEQNVRWKTKELAHTLAKAVMKFWSLLQDTSKDFKLRCPERKGQHTVESYAMRFLEYNNNNSSTIQNSAPEAPLTPEKVYDFGILDMSWGEDPLMKENLHYKIPSGATEVYRESIESYLLNLEKFGSSRMQEEGTSGFFDVTDFGSQENMFEDEEGETSSYYLPGAFEGSKSSKFAKKQQENFPFGQIAENKVNGQPSIMIGKQLGNTLNVSFHTKRRRTASRPKVLNQFSGGTRVINHADASSGDYDSFQDEQYPSNLEVNSVGGFDKKLTYDSYEVAEKPKKKKAKHLNSTYEQRLLDSNFHNEQRDHSKRKSEENHLQSNGNIGLFGQHISKKPKVIRQSLDNSSFENLGVASQMSNMPNPNKIIKLINGRDRLRKIKQSKLLSGQSDSENPWSQYEDQALVVLVHDMGPNWEFVSDALSSILRFKRIFHDSKECKERHYFLIDRTSGDGADSAEDSGSSQPYPSTLPGIPKGSARQLFQRLHGPMEEDTLKSHFEKIIRITKKRKPRNENLEMKQVQHPHASHTFALSQASPNNLSGGPVLTPLDLCDVSESSLETLSIGFQIPPSSTDPVAPDLPTPDANLSVQSASTAPPASAANTNPSPQSNPLDSPSSRFGTARSAPFDEQKKMQQLNNQNLPRSSGPGRILPGGLNRSVPLTRPGFQGLNSQNILSLPPGQGISMPRPRNHTLHKLRPIQNPELQKQQIQQGNNNPLNGLNTSFINQTTPPVQPYPALRPMTPQRPHLLNNVHIQRPISTHNQAYAVRFAKERQQQQQRLMHLSTSNGTMPPVQQSQPRPQNSPKNSSPTVTFSPLQKHLILPVRNPLGGGTGLPVEKQQPQQFPSASRQHPQQNPLSDSSQPPPHNLQKQHHLKSYQENPTAQRPIKNPPLANPASHGQSTGSLTDMRILQPEKKLCVGPASPRTE